MADALWDGLAWAQGFHAAHPHLVVELAFWLLLFLVPYSIVRVCAGLQLASKEPGANFLWIYKPIRARICQRLPGFVHATWLTYLGFKDFIHHGYRFTMLESNTDEQNYALELSLTYLIVDTVLDIVRGPELLYFLHHALLIVCFCFCGFVSNNAGGTAMMVFAVGEVSNIFMVPWHAARFCEYPSIHQRLSPFVTVSFTICRVFAALYFTYIFFYEAYNTDHKVAWPLVYTYMVAFVLLLLGSWFWVYKLLKGYFKTHTAGVGADKKSE